MTLVKVCGLTHPEDALWAARCGADLLGMVLYPPSARAVTVAQAAAIAEAIHGLSPRPRLVGVFVREDIAAVRAAGARCGLDLVQLHGGESAAYAAALERPYILARRALDPAPLDPLEAYRNPVPWAHLLDAYDPNREGGSGALWDWDSPAVRHPQGRWFLAGGLCPANVHAALAARHPWGVDASSGVERAPGRKDRERVEAFIRTVKEYDRHANTD
jgi:phosphoribosylanthranilate isomerase